MFSWLRRKIHEIPPYRKVVNRIFDEQGAEILTLDCNHSYRINRVERTSLPCPECLKDEQMRRSE